MCAEANKDIYGTLEALLLFWGGGSKSLEEMGYQRNEYVWCVMNKFISYKQCTIIWHVDYLKMSHVNPDIFSSVPADMDADYGKIVKLTSRGVKYTNTLV